VCVNDTWLSRRTLVAGAGLAAVAGVAAGCGSSKPSPTARLSGTGTGTGPTTSPAATGTPRATATPTHTPTSGTSTPTRSAAAEAALRRKIASLLIVGFRGTSAHAGDWIVRAIREQGLGGVILFDKDQLTKQRRNIISPTQVTSLIRTLKAASPGRLIVSIDQEGGTIARLNPGDGFPATRSEAQIGATHSQTAVRAWAQGIATTLRSIGVNLNFAPVCDLDINPSNPAIGALGRSFSANPNVVAAYAAIEIQQHRAAGVKTSIKHFPGFGSATGNTDFGIVDVSRTWRRIEIVPFQQLIATHTADSVLVAHLLNRQLDPSRPASLSHAVVTGLLRGQLKWNGPVVSDDMQAVAITSKYGAAEAATMALTAGVDLLVYANQQVYDPGIVGKTVDAVMGLISSGKYTEAQLDQAVARVDSLRPPK
jgi:beta-N-acetylhexosaminidase